MAGQTQHETGPKAGRIRRFAAVALGLVLLTAVTFLAVQQIFGPGPEIATTEEEGGFFDNGDGGEKVDVTGLQVARDAKEHRLLPPISGDGSFYDALLGMETGKGPKTVTVLHLGDSHIAADRITKDIRKKLQAQFGDAGRGLMMPGFPFEYYRADGVSFEKTGVWLASNSLNQDGVYGITGVSVSAASPDAQLTMTADEPFDSAVVSFLAGPGQGKAVIAQGGQRQTVDTQAAERSVLRAEVGAGQSLSISPTGEGKITVLGIATRQDEAGLRYVNLGIPGASVLTTRRWDDRLVAQDLEALSPQLVVLGYGTNEGFQDGLDIEAYRAAYEGLIAKIKQSVPNATLLILGPTDGARLPAYAKFGDAISLRCAPLSSGEITRYDEFLDGKSDALARWFPPPKLGEVREVLKETAEKEGALYLDLEEVMGGPCSIHRWAQADPPLALPDHVHLSDLGSEKIAEAIVDDLMDGYRIYRNTPPPRTGSVGETDGAAPPPEPRL
ncbi:GDSL-type esterase/lipase family protein [Methyloligella solikamskensis]|uniref:GDSL-type esterase/lipase family protein n=1 Tax=Methyloligella solikamskensis TaxID=1177756 RepID=A0ABW3J9I5_9HYPH